MHFKTNKSADLPEHLHSALYARVGDKPYLTNLPNRKLRKTGVPFELHGIFSNKLPQQIALKNAAAKIFAFLPATEAVLFLCSNFRIKSLTYLEPSDLAHSTRYLASHPS